MMLLRPGPGGNHKKAVARGLHMKDEDACIRNGTQMPCSPKAMARPQLIPSWQRRGGALAGHMARNISAKGRQATEQCIRCASRMPGPAGR